MSLPLAAGRCVNPKVLGALNQMDHLCCRMDRGTVVGEPRPG